LKQKGFKKSSNVAFKRKNMSSELLSIQNGNFEQFCANDKRTKRFVNDEFS
jgi:hypothetical protein